MDDFEILRQTSSGVSQGEGRSARFALLDIQPNPIHGAADLGFQLPERAQLRLGLYDASGRLVRTLADGWYDAGAHQIRWDGRDGVGKQAGSVVYYYRMTAGGFTATKSVVLVR